ncbi:hypothetical protein IAE24_30000, partial [Delftia sp. S65]|nr:hypothetical protein [Delftia sp. S65]
MATIEKDANATQTEVTGRTIEAINAKTADTGVTAFLSEDGTTIELRATAAPTGTTGTTASVAVGTNAATSLTAITAAEGKGIDKVDVSTQSGAWEAMQRIDNAIDKVN